MTATLVLADASRAWPGVGPVVEGLSWEVRAGEVVALVGPSGGGKTTALLLAAGLVLPTSGAVRICGVDAHRVAVERPGSVGFVAADGGLYPLLTGWENLAFFAGLRGSWTVRALAQPLLERLCLPEDAMNRRTGTWSSGMRQKLALVRAMADAPRLLLLDEPTAHVDPDVTVVVTDALRDAAHRGAAVLWATHDLAAAHAVSDRLVWMNRRVLGTVAASGAPLGRLADLA